MNIRKQTHVVAALHHITTEKTQPQSVSLCGNYYWILFSSVFLILNTDWKWN